MDIEAEIRDLKKRVGELEGSFAFLTRQIAAVHKDLLEARSAIDALRRELPGLIAAGVAEGLRRT